MTPMTTKKRKTDVADKENMMILSNSHHKQALNPNKAALKFVKQNSENLNPFSVKVGPKVNDENNAPAASSVSIFH